MDFTRPCGILGAGAQGIRMPASYDVEYVFNLC